MKRKSKVLSLMFAAGIGFLIAASQSANAAVLTHLQAGDKLQVSGATTLVSVQDMNKGGATCYVLLDKGGNGEGVSCVK